MDAKRKRSKSGWTRWFIAGQCVERESPDGKRSVLALDRDGRRKWRRVRS